MKDVGVRIRMGLLNFWNQRQPREQGLLVVLGVLLVGAGLLQGEQWLVERNVSLANQLPILRADVEYLEARSVPSGRQHKQGLETGVRQLALMFPGLESHPVADGVELHWQGKELVSWLRALDRVSGRTAWVVRKADIERHADEVEVRLVVAP